MQPGQNRRKHLRVLVAFCPFCMDIDANAWDTVHPLRRYPVENGDCFRDICYPLMVLSKIVELPALRHCKGDNRLFFLLCLLCGFLLQGGSFFLKISFHTRKILPKRPGLALCNKRRFRQDNNVCLTHGGSTQYRLRPAVYLCI